MSNQNDRFIGLALSGDVLLLEIDDYVSAWHEGTSEETLSDYLGMTAAEYALWVSEPDMLSHIVRARRERISLDDLVQAVVNDNSPAGLDRVAARTDDTIKVERLKRWLRSEGIDLS